MSLLSTIEPALPIACIAGAIVIAISLHNPPAGPALPGASAAAPEADLVVRARPFGVGLPAFCLADEIDPRVAARCEQIQLARLEMNRMLNDTVQYARQIGLDG